MAGKNTVKKIKTAINDGIEDAKILEVKEKKPKKDKSNEKEIKDDDK